VNINKVQNENRVLLELSGRLDTTTAPQLEAEINAITGDATGLTLDFSGLEYLSSAGLRVILMAQKKMAPLDGMTVKNVNETIMEVFEITGFAGILSIE
jgi:anti-sigma B factor antagonist